MFVEQIGTLERPLDMCPITDPRHCTVGYGYSLDTFRHIGLTHVELLAGYLLEMLHHHHHNDRRLVFPQAAVRDQDTDVTSACSASLCRSLCVFHWLLCVSMRVQRH